MSKQEEANLILKLYELRREEMMRRARSWYFADFNPESAADVNKAMVSEQSGLFRMVVSYWDMAASFVNHGAISLDFFNDANGEQLGIFAKVEPFLAELRAIYSPNFMKNLERLIDSTPGGREQVAGARERMKAMRADYMKNRK
jgi:hypothetical protein